METQQSSIIIYRPENTSLELAIKADPEHRNVWGTQRQIAELLGLTVQAVSYHVQNFKEQRKERADRSIKRYLIVAEDGKTREVEHYDMTAITWIGFQAKASERVMAFQDWVGEQLDKLAGQAQGIKRDWDEMTMIERGAYLRDMGQHIYEHDLAIYQHEQRLTELERVVKNNQEYYTVKGYYNLRRMGSVSDVESRRVSRAAKKLSKERMMAIEEIPNSEWGKLNAYHVSILDEVTGFKPVDGA